MNRITVALIVLRLQKVLDNKSGLCTITAGLGLAAESDCSESPAPSIIYRTQPNRKGDTMKTIIDILTKSLDKKSAQQALDYAIEKLAADRDKNKQKLRLFRESKKKVNPASVEEYIDPLGWYDSE